MSNIHITSTEELILPTSLIEEFPGDKKIHDFVASTRQEISRIINGEDKRMLVIVGPCSIHNIDEAKVYGNRLRWYAENVREKYLVVMRVYFEKPRTTIGWKGLINDPDLDNTFNVNKGLKMARELLLYLYQK